MFLLLNGINFQLASVFNDNYLDKVKTFSTEHSSAFCIIYNQVHF